MDATHNSDDIEALRRKAHALIPGGAHTYAKGDDQYPANAPPFIARGAGCHVWDAQGTEFIEYGMGLRSVTLGHAFPAVLDAAERQMRLGANFTRPAPIEVETAERLLAIVTKADMVKFGKNGSDATTAAVKLARAATGRSLVAVCADHPFFSVDDWFIGTTPIDGGIPKVIQDLTVTFRFNDLASLEALFTTHPGKIACVMLEPEKNVIPRDGFLHKAQALCHRHGALFILDETITGFRHHIAGSQAIYDVAPDLSIYGKALGNGFSVSALLGKREFMRLGGIDHDQPRVFLMSTTNGAETHSLAAAIAVMDTYQQEPVIETLYARGAQLAAGIRDAAQTLGLADHFGVLGKPCNLVYFTHDQDGKPSQPFRTLFLQELIRRGVIAPSFVVSYSHTPADIERTVEAVRAALVIYARALESGVDEYLEGPSVKPVFRRFC